MSVKIENNIAQNRVSTTDLSLAPSWCFESYLIHPTNFKLYQKIDLHSDYRPT